MMLTPKKMTALCAAATVVVSMTGYFARNAWADVDVPCPPCTYSASGRYLYGSMSADYAANPYPFTNMKIRLYKNSVLKDTVTLSPSTVYGTTSVSQSVGTSETDIDKAVLQWTDDDAHQVTQDIPVD